MNLLGIALRLTLSSILEKVDEACGDLVPDGVGQMLGRGLHGEVYELPSDDGVIKVGIAKDAAEAQAIVDRITATQSKNKGALADMKEAGVLCDVDTKDKRWVHGQGTAFYYVMEKLEPLPADEAKVAIRTLVDLVELKEDPKKYMFSRKRVLKRDGDDPEVADRALDLFQRMKASGISHRDLNAGNIARAADGSYKLIDLESAR